MINFFITTLLGHDHLVILEIVYNRGLKEQIWILTLDHAYFL